VTQPPAGPPDGRTVPRFAGPDTFARLPRLLDVGAADVALLGIPFDIGEAIGQIEAGASLALGSSAHVGVRGPPYASADLIEDAGLGFATVSTAEVAQRGVDQAVDRIRERVGARPVYLSVDIDVLDPAHAPGTGTPEPGGLTSRELQFILRGMEGLQLAGAGVVEVSPSYDHAELTALAAANVAYQMLSLFARGAR
jgi:agmatinase